MPWVGSGLVNMAAPTFSQAAKALWEVLAEVAAEKEVKKEEVKKEEVKQEGVVEEAQNEYRVIHKQTNPIEKRIVSEYNILMHDR